MSAEKPLELVRPAAPPPARPQRRRTAGSARSVTISAVKIAADGKRTQLGVISAWHRNPLKRAWWRVRIWFNRWSRR